MKGKRKLCVISGSMLVVAVLGVTLLLNGVMSSADGKLKTFDAGQSASGAGAVLEKQEEKTKEKPAKEKTKKAKEKEDPSKEVTTSFVWTQDDHRSWGENIASYARCWEGVRYEYGGADRQGVDSSGFIQAVYDRFDITLPRSCKEQAKIGVDTRIKDLVPGDLIFYGASGDKVTHGGIYIGEGKVIHSSSKAGKVVISDMNYRRIVTVRGLTCALLPGERKSDKNQ